MPVFPDVPKSWKWQAVGRDNIAFPGRILKKSSSRCGGGRGVGIEAKRNVQIVHLQRDVNAAAAFGLTRSLHACAQQHTPQTIRGVLSNAPAVAFEAGLISRRPGLS